MNRRALLIFLLALCTLAPVAWSDRPANDPAAFGLIADVQYADQDDSGGRHYRSSLQRLRECISDLNQQGLAFTIQLGDLTDGGRENLRRVLTVLNELSGPTYHVLGNHDLSIGREAAMTEFGLTNPYYSFDCGAWRFIVLDCQDVSLEGGWPPESERRAEAQRWLEQLKQEGRPYAQPWNGGIGPDQIAWLKQQLAEASAHHRRVIVFGHMPLLAEASADWALLYNHEEVRQLLEASGCVAAYLCGHEHAGGYAFHNGLHHVTLQGMVEATQSNAYAVVRLYQDRIEISGAGAVPDRCLSLAGTNHSVACTLR